MFSSRAGIYFALALSLIPTVSLAGAEFEAKSDIDVSGLYDAVKKATNHGVARYSSGPESDDVEIYDDWSNLIGKNQPIFTFMADMDVDCDGSYVKECTNDPDGQTDTSWGHLDASQVPWFVIPEVFRKAHSSDLLPNALGAVICNGKMFYAIYGDENGDDPPLIGEASILLAQTCFPDDGLDGDNGHVERDIAYIVFGQQVPSGIEDKTIDIAALKALGDEQVSALQDQLGLSTS